MVLETAVVLACFGGLSMVVSVLFYNMRRSRCTKCKGCGCEIERQNMNQDELKADEINKLPMAL